MDPDEALANLRKLMQQLYDELPGPDIQSTRIEDLASEIVEQFEALDGWLTRGGFLPAAWSR